MLGKVHKYVLLRASTENIVLKEGKDKADEVESRNDTCTAENATENLGESLRQIETAVKNGRKDVLYLKSFLNDRGIMIHKNDKKKN